MMKSVCIFRLAAFLLCLALMPSTFSRAQSASPGGGDPVLSIAVEDAILRLREAPAVTGTKLRAATIGFPQGAKLAYQWRQVQDEMTARAARMKDQPVTFTGADQPEVTACFSSGGVYEIRLTVTDTNSKRAVSRNTWINVWDSRSPILINGKSDPLSAIPGMTPPKVRNLSPDPGPFRHPRLYCGDAEWKDINARCVGGKSKLAAASWKGLVGQFDAGISPKTPDGKILAELEIWADANYAGAMPSLTRGKKDAKDFESDTFMLCYRLGLACFIQWVKHDPAQGPERVPSADQALRRKLAKQAAALARALLDAQWDRATGAFHKNSPMFLARFDELGESTMNLSGLAFAYDFAYAWMTPQQQREVRNLLVAGGCGRKGPGQGAGHASAQNRWVERGFEQNGNYASMGDSKVLASLAVQGEESGADPAVVKAFIQPPKPANYAKARGALAYDWMQLADTDSGGDQPIAKPYPEAISWPHARKSDVNTLQKEIWTWQDSHLSPWGFAVERLAYFGSMTNEVWPMAAVFARFGGFNQFVGCDFYQSVNNVIFVQYPSGGMEVSKSFSSPLGMYEHHSGGGDYRQQHILMLKYMYPDDPLVDYAYATQAPQIENRVRDQLNTCVFGLDPAITNLSGALEPVAKAKELPLTKLDPLEGLVIMRSGWKDDALMLHLDAGATMWGHMNAERSAFSFFALGRHWAVPTGFHKVFSNFQSLVAVQNPAWAACPETQGFMSVNPSIAPKVPGCDYTPGFPTPPTKLLEVRESPDGLWSVAACDAKASYNYACGAPKGMEKEQPTMSEGTDYLYPGLAAVLERLSPGRKFRSRLWPQRGCGLQDAFRTVLVVRGPRPYALIVDDFRKQAPANWRWMMNDKVRMKDEDRVKGPEGEEFCVMLAPGSTPTDAVLLHRRDQGEKPGMPRLLVRDVSEVDNSKQPAMRQDRTVFTNLGEDKYPSEATNRLLIERNGVASPQYKVLLFPYRTGEALPVTAWNAERTELTVNLGGGLVDRISCTRVAGDMRTRLSLTRTGGNGSGH